MMAARHLGGSSMRSYLTSIKVEPVPGASLPITVTMGTTENAFYVKPAVTCFQLATGDEIVLTLD